jgi:hypothetical protein
MVALSMGRNGVGGRKAGSVILTIPLMARQA